MPIDPVVLPHSFCTFLFPFQFRSEDYEVITTKLEKESHKAKPAWTLHIFQNEDLLPHIANFLNSPANGGGQARRATALSWDLGDNALGHHEFLGARCAWTCIQGEGERKVALDFEVTEVNLTLFKIGVGFLRLQTKPKTETLGNWQDFTHYFRFMEGGRSPIIKVCRKVGKDQWESCRPGVLGLEPPGDQAPRYIPNG